MGEYSVAVDEVSEVERGVQITVERSAFQRRFDRAVGQAMNQAHIKGFRGSSMSGRRPYPGALGFALARAGVGPSLSSIPYTGSVAG